MALTVEEGKDIVKAFCAEYPSAYQVQFKLRDTQEEVFNEKATIEAVGKIYGAYFPSRNIAGFATSNFRDKDQFEGTLKHEILGHFGLNTCTTQEKHAILDAIADSKDKPGISELWQKISKHYPDSPDMLIAEEVFAFACEEVNSNDLVNSPGGRKTLDDCIGRSKPLELDDLKNLTLFIAAGLRDGTRQQQIFPLSDGEQFKKETKKMAQKKPFHETVAETLIEQLKAGTAPWQKPWNPGEGGHMPVNPTTGNRYKGINAIQLMSQGREDNRWLTYKQAASIGAQVRAKEKGTPIQFWQFTEEKPKLDENGKPVLSSEGEVIKETVKLERPRTFMAHVFNAEQIEGMPPLERKEKIIGWEANERAENILQASGASITHSDSNRAFYRSSTDTIHLPEKSQFDSDDKYYATALHELGHWTGHSSRLNRDLANPFGSEAYAKEELRAEIASMIIGNEIGVGHDPGQHAAYVGSWIKALKDDPLEIFRAAADAEKIQNYVLTLEQKQEQKLEQKEDLSIYSEQALDYLTRFHGVQTLSDSDKEFLKKAERDEKLSPVVAAMELAEARSLPLNDQGFIFKTVDNLISNSDAVRKFDSLSFTDTGVDEESGIHKFVFNSDKSNFKHVVGIDVKEREASVIETISKDGGASREPDLSLFINDVKSLPYNLRLEADLEPSIGFHNLFEDSIAHESGTSLLVFNELTRLHREANEGYDPLESWNNLQASAKELGLDAKITTNWSDDEFDATWNIRYYTSSGEDTQIATEMYQDGKAATSYKDERVPGTGLTSDTEWQQQALATAHNSYSRDLAMINQNPQQQEAAPAQSNRAEQWTLNHLLADTVSQAMSNASTTQLNAATTMLESMLPLESGNAFWQRNDLPENIELLESRISSAIEWTKERSESIENNSNQLQDRVTELLARAAERGDAGIEDDHRALAEAVNEDNDHERSVKFALLNESLVRRDPNSTEDDILAAKEVRKEAELSAMLNDQELSKSLEEDKAFIIQQESKSQAGVGERVYLAVPFGEKEVAKQAKLNPSGPDAVSWDKKAKSWFISPNGDKDKLSRWMPDRVQNRQESAKSPHEEFADALRSIGCIVSGEHPIMDGKRHRIAAEGDKAGERAGFYIGHLDGHPAGYIQNNRTGAKMKWKSKGYSLSDEEKAQLAATAATKMAEREKERDATHQATASRIEAHIGRLLPITEPTPYLSAKEASAHVGALTDEKAKTTFIPAQDVDGKIWTMQYINEDGTKRFAKDSKKEGCFHVVGGEVGKGMEALATAPALVVGEGYATADTCREVLGFPTVAAFDSGNLPAVVSALHEKFPAKPVIVVGDDDRALVMKQGNNPGRDKAEAAAKSVGGSAIFPTFTAKETGYPDHLPPITPDVFRNSMSSEQSEALERIEKYTDFNDMKTKSELGIDGVKRQLSAAVALSVKKHQSIDDHKKLNLSQTINREDTPIKKKAAVRIN